MATYCTSCVLLSIRTEYNTFRFTFSNNLCQARAFGAFLTLRSSFGQPEDLPISAYAIYFTVLYTESEDGPNFGARALSAKSWHVPGRLTPISLSSDRPRVLHFSTHVSELQKCKRIVMNRVGFEPTLFRTTGIQRRRSSTFA